MIRPVDRLGALLESPAENFIRSQLSVEMWWWSCLRPVPSPIGVGSPGGMPWFPRNPWPALTNLLPTAVEEVSLNPFDGVDGKIEEESEPAHRLLGWGGESDLGGGGLYLSVGGNLASLLPYDSARLFSATIFRSPIASANFDLFLPRLILPDSAVLFPISAIWIIRRSPAPSPLLCG